MNKLSLYSVLHNKIRVYFIFSFLLFLLNPFAAIVLTLLIIFNDAKNAGNNIKLLCLYLSVYMGLINSTKVPESDLLHYKEYFLMASESTLFEYLFFFGREPVFYGFTYFLNALTFGNYLIYIFLLTIIIYYLNLKSIYEYWKYYDGRRHVIVFSILLFSFFYIVFSGSSHLIRQVLAGSIFVYYLTGKSTHKKNRWYLPILAILIHSSSAVLFLLTLIPGIEKKINVNRAFLYVILTLAIILSYNIIVNVMVSIFSEIPFMRYLVLRSAALQPDNDTREFVTDFSLIARFILPLFLLFIASLVFIFKKNYKIYDYSFLNITIILFLILEILHALEFNFLAVRLNYYMYFFIPFVVPFSITLFKSKESQPIVKPILSIIVLVSFSSWLWFINTSQWTYASVFEIILSPVLLYFV